MRKLLVLTAILSLLLACPALGSAEEELKVFIWSEYMDPEIPVQFEKEFGIKVRIDLYENNEEMVAKLQAGGVGLYDIIVPSGLYYAGADQPEAGTAARSYPDSQLEEFKRGFHQDHL